MTPVYVVFVKMKGVRYLIRRTHGVSYLSIMPILESRSCFPLSQKKEKRKKNLDLKSI